MALLNLPPPPAPVPVPPAEPLFPEVTGENLGAGDAPVPLLAPPAAEPPLGDDVTGAVGCAIFGIADFGIGILKFEFGFAVGFGITGDGAGFGAGALGAGVCFGAVC